MKTYVWKDTQVLIHVVICNEIIQVPIQITRIKQQQQLTKKKYMGKNGEYKVYRK